LGSEPFGLIEMVLTGGI